MSREKIDCDINDLISENSKAIHQLYQVLLPRVARFVQSNKGSYSDAEEVFQEALAQIVTRAKVGGISISTTLDSYIFITCRNLWFRETKNRNKLLRYDGLFEFKEQENNTWEMQQTANQEHLFEEKLLELSDNCRKILKDYFENVSYHEIVKKYNYSNENTAFQRVFKCKKRLIKLIKACPSFKVMNEDFW